jgi:hypothetical protein
MSGDRGPQTPAAHSDTFEPTRSKHSIHPVSKHPDQQQRAEGDAQQPAKRESASRWRNQAAGMRQLVHPASGLGLAGGGGQGAEDGEHRVEVGQPGAEFVDEVGQGEVALDQVLVVLGDVVDQLAHQGGVDLLELAERLPALLDHRLVPLLPALQLGDLPGPLLAGDLRGLAGQLELMLLVLEDLLLKLEGLRLEPHQHLQEGDRVGVRTARGRRRLPGRGNFHPVRP